MLRCRKSATAELRCVPPATGVPATGAAHVPGFQALNLEGVEMVLTVCWIGRTCDAVVPAARSRGGARAALEVGDAGVELRASGSRGSTPDGSVKVQRGSGRREVHRWRAIAAADRAHLSFAPGKFRRCTVRGRGWSARGAPRLQGEAAVVVGKGRGAAGRPVHGGVGVRRGNGVAERALGCRGCGGTAWWCTGMVAGAN